MSTTLARSNWTGTRGIVDGGLPDDWDEAFAIVSRNCGQPCCNNSQSQFDYTPTIVQRAWEWLLREFGQEVEHANLSVRDVVELYLES